MTDWGQLYRDNVEAVAALVTGLDDEHLARTVPATPAWTVHDVLRHLAGGAADALAGRTDDAPGPAWTSRHVGERLAASVDDLVTELRGNAEAIAATTVDNPRPAIVWDIAVHHADLHEALGLGEPPERFWLPVYETVGTTKGAALVDRTSPYEVFRAVFSRRSRRQLQALGLDDAAIEELCIFGPREDDQPPSLSQA